MPALAAMHSASELATVAARSCVSQLPACACDVVPGSLLFEECGQDLQVCRDSLIESGPPMARPWVDII